MLEIKNLCFSVTEEAGENAGKTKEIIKNLSLVIEDGEFAVITGPNGGGKSTLAKLIMGIEKPISGQIIFDGTDITDMPISERANLGIGFGFQQPARFKGMKVKKLLSIAQGEKVPCLSCNETLSKVGLCSLDYLNREVDKNLSGGEIKRIEIATILARNPKFAIFDEPEAGIDLWSFERLTDTFREMHENSENTMVIISHQERIMDLADRIILIKDGTVSQEGPKEEIMASMGIKTAVNAPCAKTHHETDITAELTC